MPDATEIDPVSGTLAAAQTVMGIVQSISGGIKANKALRERKAFKTPQEAAKILNASESMASQGLDPFTLNYLTGEVNRSTAKTLGIAERLGADPNVLSSILQTNIEGLMKIGAENHAQNMKNFGQYLGALDMMSKNKEAEWASQQDIVKDRLQQAAALKGAGMANIGSAANAFISISSADRIANLYRTQKDTGLKQLTNPDGSPHFEIG